MTRLLLLGFILLHMVDGREAWFRGEEVLYVATPDKKIWALKAGSVILVHDKEFAVQERPTDVLRAIEEAK